jgi:hypothetical protein
MQRHLFIIICLFALALKIEAQDKFLTKLLKKHESKFENVLKDPSKYRIQILYTQIDRNKENVPHFKTYSYRLNEKEYFYPASTVKMPTAFAALEKLSSLQIAALTRNTPMLHGTGHPLQTAVTSDSTSSNGLPSLAHYIKKIFMVSDNDAHNRLYEFVGQKSLNEELWKKGLKNTRLIHRLSVLGFDQEANRHTNPVSFYKEDTLLYYQGPVYSRIERNFNLEGEKMGRGYLSRGQVVEQPFDFTERNFISISNLNDCLKSVLFPQYVPENQRFDFTEEDYRFLYQVMSELPRESNFPDYSSLPDNYVKFFIFGDNDTARIPSNIRIFNKVGTAYGFLTDVAYVVDFEHQIEFMLGATIYVNEDGIFNDDKYEYKTIGFPFLANLGRVIYDYEKERKRKYKPNLSRFKVDTYD